MRNIPRRADGASERDSLIDLTSANETIRVSLRRVAGAKRFTLRVRAANRDVVLTMPWRASAARAREFAERNAAWIAARVGRLPEAVRFEPGAVIPVFGEPHAIVHRERARGVVWIEPAAEDGALPSLCVAGAPEHVARRVGAFLRREAHGRLRAAVAKHAEAIGVAVQRVVVRDTTSRWGSCSATGSLSFSWRLVMAPDLVLDYLAAHEVAHRRHHNHSPAFWALTRSMAPHTDRAEAWLKARGAELHRYGPARG